MTRGLQGAKVLSERTVNEQLRSKRTQGQLDVSSELPLNLPTLTRSSAAQRRRLLTVCACDGSRRSSLTYSSLSRVCALSQGIERPSTHTVARALAESGSFVSLNSFFPYTLFSHIIQTSPDARFCEFICTPFTNGLFL